MNENRERLKTASMAFEIGGMLVNAKRLLPHGEFGKWVLENLPFSHREANNFIKLHKACEEMPATKHNSTEGGNHE